MNIVWKCPADLGGGGVGGNTVVSGMDELGGDAVNLKPECSFSLHFLSSFNQGEIMCYLKINKKHLY